MASSASSAAARPAPADPVELLRGASDAQAALDAPAVPSGHGAGAIVEPPARRCRARSRGSTPRCAACPGVHALLSAPDLADGLAARLEVISARLDDLEAELDADAGASPSLGSDDGRGASDLEALNAALVRARDAVWAVGRDRLRTARAVAALAGAAGRRRRARRLPLGAGRARRDRPAGGARAATPPGCTSSCTDTALDLDAPDLAARGRAAGGRPAVPLGLGAARRRPHAFVRLQGRRRDRRARRQHRGAPRRDRRRRAAAPRAVGRRTAEVVVLGHTRWASVGIISEANAHPLNQEEVDRATAPTSWARSTATSTTTPTSRRSRALHALSRDHHRRQGDPGAGVAPARAARARRRLPRRRSRELEGSLAIGAQAASSPDELLLSLRGSGQALYVGLAEDAFVVASEPYGLVEETARYLRLDGETPADPERADGDARPGRAARRRRVPARSRASSRSAFDGTPLPVTADEIVERRDHHTRHRPRLVPALPPQGDLGGPGIVPQDAARSHRRDRPRPPGCARRRRRSRPTSCAASGTGRSRASWRSGRAPPPSRGRARPRRLSVSSVATSVRTRWPRPSSRGSGSRRHVRHARRRHQPERHHHRHQPHRRPRARPRRLGHRDRQPAQQRPRRQVRRRALHVRRPRPRDGGAVHQGVLRADRRRATCSRWRSQPSSAPSTRRRRHERARVDCGRCPTRCRPCSCERDAIAAIAQRHVPSRPLLDGRRQRAEPHRRQRGAHQALGALLQLDLGRHRRGQEAHRPLHRAAHPRVRGRARRAPTPTTWPRRSRTTARTVPRRS